MADLFPDTRLTLLGRLQTRSMGKQWEQSWGEFFNLYHDIIKTCVKGAFYRKGWKSLADADQNEVAMEVIHAIYKDNKTGTFIELDFSKGRFRQIIQAICSHKVSDFIRSKKRFKNHRPIEDVQVDPEVNKDANLMDDQHQQSENRAFLKAQVATLMDALHAKVSPQAYQIFERVKLLGDEAKDVAADMGISRGVVDNSIHKTKKILKELIHGSGISKEFMPDAEQTQVISLETLTADESLNELGKLYQEHEAFQQSPEHQALSKRFEQTVRESEKLAE